MRLVRVIIINVIIILFLFIFIEGITSYAIVIRDNLIIKPVAERLHSKYDPEIGWVNIPNIFIQDLYGPGIYFQTNEQGFRNKQSFNKLVPSGKTRIICSGDSFTLGYGVDNDHDWPQVLSKIDTCIEIINMGQGGYGIDQAYLFFKNAIDTLEFNIHIFAFITNDIDRMQSKKFLGYGKPILKLENSDLKVENVPVPTSSFKHPWIRSVIKSVNQLRTMMTIILFKNKFKSMLTNNADVLNNSKNIDTENILYEVFKNLKEINTNNNSQLILVYLPDEYNITHYPKRWMKIIETASRDLEIPLINLIDKFRMLPQKETENFFIHSGQIEFIAADGHLTNFGNKVVAEMIYDELKNKLHYNTCSK